MARFKTIATVVASLVAMLVMVPSSGASLNTRFGTGADGMVTVPAFGALASRIVGSPTTVRCFAASVDGFELGHTEATVNADGAPSFAPVIYLSGAECGDLWSLLHWRSEKDWMRNAWTSSQYAGEVLLTLEHEAMHLRLASLDEGVVECAAYQNVWPVLVSLGLPRWFRAQVYDGVRQAHRNSPAVYQTVC